MTRVLAACVLAAALAVPARGAEPLQHGVGPRSVAAVVSGNTTVVTLGDGRSVSLETGSSFVAHDLAAAGSDWLVAGSRRGIDGRERLALLAGSGRRPRELRPPGGQTAAVRAQPVILDGDRVLDGRSGGGVAWLEGSSARRFAVWSSEWNGDEFETLELVAPAGAGTQTALAGTVLADGSWLLVWSAFDGRDDEILWSRRTDRGWSEPTRIAADDSSPDITPAITASGDGAVVAWSSYENGGYRLALATFRDRSWSEPSLLDGPSGLYPSFVRGVDTPTLTYLEGSPRRWVVSEIEARDRRELARVAVDSRAVERPLLLELDVSGVSLRFPADGVARGVRGSTVRRSWGAAR